MSLMSLHWIEIDPQERKKKSMISMAQGSPYHINDILDPSVKCAQQTTNNKQQNNKTTKQRQQQSSLSGNWLQKEKTHASRLHFEGCKRYFLSSFFFLWTKQMELVRGRSQSTRKYIPLYNYFSFFISRRTPSFSTHFNEDTVPRYSPSRAISCPLLSSMYTRDCNPPSPAHDM